MKGVAFKGHAPGSGSAASTAAYIYRGVSSPSLTCQADGAEKRAVVVALVVIAISGAVSGFSVVIAGGAAQMPSGSAVVVLALIFAVPVTALQVLGRSRRARIVGHEKSG